MPSVQKHGKRWRVQIARKGVRLSRIFDSKTEAQAWGRQQEAGILDGKQRPTALTVGDMLNQYGKVVSSTKRGSASASTKSGSGSGSGSFGDGGAGLASNVDVAGAATRTAGDHGAPPSSAPVVAASGGASNGGKSKWLADLPPALLKKGNRFRKFAPAAGRS